MAFNEIDASVIGVEHTPEKVDRIALFSPGRSDLIDAIQKGSYGDVRIALDEVEGSLEDPVDIHKLQILTGRALDGYSKVN